MMSAMRIGLLVLAVPLLVGGCTGGAINVERHHPENPTENPVWSYRVVPGDVIAIEGGANMELSKESVRVDENGEVNLLYIGRVMAAGKTMSELEDAINNAYRESGKYPDPQVSVSVLTLFYYVDGEVRVTGKKPYIREITVYRAIVDAGGFTEFAAPSRVRLLRPTADGSTKVYVINVDKMMRGAPDNIVILPNDMVRVPKSVF